MKKIISILFLLFLATNSSFAINWQTVETPLGKTAYVDVDSIVEEDNYYFYNIKIFNEYIKDYSVITIQSSKTKPFSARINAYKTNDYENLNGDYSNITYKRTTKLEPVTFESTVNSCYKFVKSIKTSSNTNISF